jgi:cbb3-type cytochrome c oxidase subunit III
VTRQANHRRRAVGSAILALGAAVLLAGTAAQAAAETALPVPPGATKDQVAAGATVFQNGTCGGCHGEGGKGTPIAPDLTSGNWLWGDSLPEITKTIAKGVPSPQSFRSPMPPMGGMQLSPQDLSSISAYVWAIGHQGQP